VSSGGTGLYQRGLGRRAFSSFWALVRPAHGACITNTITRKSSRSATKNPGRGPRLAWSRGPQKTRSIFPVQRDQLALNPDPVRRQNADFVGGVCRLERDRGAAAAEALQRCLLLVDQRHHD